MAELNPPLGTTTPEIFLDNVKRADELVNGPPATVPDRGGEPLDSWRLIMQRVATAIIEAQNSITAIGLPFSTLDDAQAAVADGKIPEGSVTWVRNIDDTELADEYKNIAGTLTATGRKLPSQQSIDKYFQVLPDGTFALMADNGVVLAIDKNAVTRAVSLAVQDLISIGGASIRLYPQASGFYILGENGMPLALGPDSVLRLVAANIGGVGFDQSIPGVPLAFTVKNGIAGALDIDGNLRIPGVITETLTVAGKEIDGGGGSGTGFAAGDRYVDSSGSIVPVLPDPLKMSAWGSSSLVRYDADVAFAALAEELGVSNWNNQGQGGETSFQIAARFGSVPFSLVFPGNTIPASGTVNVSCTQLPSNFRNSFLKTYSGVVGGVSGTLSWSSASSLRFTRDVPGSSVSLTGAADFIPTLPESYRDGVVLLWMYKNDITYGPGNPEVNPEATFNNVVKTFEHVSTFAKRCLVIGIFNDSSYSDTDYLNRVATLNSMMRAKFGDLYCDTQDYLCSEQVWIDTGITPTAQDLTMQAAGYKATSLSGDTLHLNYAASKAVVENVIKQKLISLGWYKSGV
ncbi:hypothetical protein ACLZTU_13545 [Raoultella ornithinolytica]|uniref:hypothetical protein n=1 Tax=Raoultella ornithinolytica TaxID=54291 RepID=UPI0039B50219